MPDAALFGGGPDYGEAAEAAEKASQAQIESSKYGALAAMELGQSALNFMSGMYQIGRTDLAPYRFVGKNAENELSMLMGLGAIPDKIPDNARMPSTNISLSPGLSNYLLPSSSQGGGVSGGMTQQAGTGGNAFSGNVLSSGKIQAPGVYYSGGKNVFASGGETPVAASTLVARRGTQNAVAPVQSTTPSAYIPGPNGEMVPVYGAQTQAPYYDTKTKKLVTPSGAPTNDRTAAAQARQAALLARRGIKTPTEPQYTNKELQDQAMSRFYTSPGYEFRLGEGKKLIEDAASSKGSLFSGSTMKALDKYGEGLAANEFSDYYNRMYGLANQGLNATTTTANTGSQLGSSAGNLLASLGSTLANSAMNQGNARASGYINVANANMAGDQAKANSFNNLFNTAMNLATLGAGGFFGGGKLFG